MGCKTLSIWYQNVRGMRTKGTEFFASVAGTHHDVIAVTETALREDSLVMDYFPDNWIVYRADRDTNVTGKVWGGGSLIAVCSQLQSYHRKDLDFSECVWVEIKMKDGINLLIGNCYFSPDTRPEKLTEFFDDVGKKLEVGRYRVLILGDFNVAGVNWTDNTFNEYSHFYAKKKAYELFGFMDDLGLSQYNHHLPKGGKSILDLVISNIEVIVEEETNCLVFPDAPHDPLVIRVAAEIITTSCRRQVFNYHKGDYLGLYNTVQEIDWEVVYASPDVNEAACLVTDALSASIAKHVPFKKVKPKKYPSWFSAALIWALKKKNVAHRKYRKTGSVQHYVEFSQLRRQVKILLRQDEIKRARVAEDDLRGKPANLFKYVKSFLKDAGGVRPIKINNRVVTDASELSDQFGGYFESVYQPSNWNGTLDEDVGESVDVTDIPIITEADVLSAIKELRGHSAAGIDGIPPFIIKGVADLIAPVLTWLYNFSLRTATVPDCWRRALVSPIPKKGDLHDIRNYRPVSVLNVVSKVFEKLIHVHLYNSLRGSIDARQHGFMSCRSTATNLYEMMSFVAPEVEGRGQVDTVYFDFRKAFDTVPHDIMLRKLSHYGIKGAMLKWVQSYLVNRTFQVKVAGEISRVYRASSGVPQGSNLGPLLFIIFINDIGKGIQSKLLMFADDVKLCAKMNNWNDYVMLQQDIDRLCHWATKNRMPLNLEKTIVATYSRKTIVTKYEYRINNHLIKRKDYVCDLGVTFDAKLLFTRHIDNITSRARRNLGLLLWISRNFQHATTILLLYQTNVRPILEYCSLIWNYKRENTSQQIEAVQKRLLFMLRLRGLSEGNLSYEEECNSLGLRSLLTRRIGQDVLFLYKAIYGYIDVDISGIGFRVPYVNGRKHVLFQCLQRGTLTPLFRCIKHMNDFCNDREVNVFEPRLSQFKLTLKERLNC